MAFKRNIGTTGRVIRALFALTLLGGGVFLLLRDFVWPGVALFACSGFVLFEALRGWCVMRACGIKTKW